jgi:GNAT superfamily N-acetyltransferase
VPDKRPSPLTLLDKTFTRVRTRGPIEIGHLAYERLREAVASTDVLIIHVRAVTPADREIDIGAGDLEIRAATAADGELYARDIGTDSARTFAARLSESTRCFLVISEGVAIHATWVTTAAAWTRELKRYLRPPAGDAYIYESFTRADARGRGTYPLALAYIAKDAAERRIGRLWVAVEEDNPSSLRAVAKAGFEEAFRLPYGRKLGRVWVGEPEGPMAEIGRVFVRTSP